MPDKLPPDTYCTAAADGEHVWQLKRTKNIRVYQYHFWYCLLCGQDEMTIEPTPGSPNGHES